MQKWMTDQVKENRKSSGKGMQEELPEDLWCPCFREVEEAVDQKPMGLREVRLVVFSSVGASLVTHMVKNLPAVWETWVWSMCWADPLEEDMRLHSSILAWRIPWTEELGGLQSMGLQRVRYDWMTKCSYHGGIVQVALVVKSLAANTGDIEMQVLSLGWEDPGEGNGNPLNYSCLGNLHGQKSLVGYSPSGCKESDMTETI